MTAPEPIATHEALPLEYWVETTRSPSDSKSAYIRRMTTADFAQAVFFYRCINLGNGYKKRLRVYSKEFGTTKTLKRETS